MVHKFTDKDKAELMRMFREEYTREQLKDFIAKSVGEEALLVLSTGQEDTAINAERREMSKTLSSLREVAVKELKRKSGDK